MTDSQKVSIHRFIKIIYFMLQQRIQCFTDPGCIAQGIAFDIGQVPPLLASHQFFSAVPRSHDFV